MCNQGADAVVPDFSKVTLSSIFDPLFAGETEILSKCPHSHTRTRSSCLYSSCSRYLNLSRSFHLYFSRSRCFIQNHMKASASWYSDLAKIHIRPTQTVTLLRLICGIPVRRLSCLCVCPYEQQAYACLSPSRITHSLEDWVWHSCCHAMTETLRDARK